MKKTYFTPSATIVKVATNSILAGSTTEPVNVNSDATVGEGGYGGPQAKDAFDFDDDDEDL